MSFLRNLNLHLWMEERVGEGSVRSTKRREIHEFHDFIIDEVRRTLRNFLYDVNLSLRISESKLCN